MRHPTLYTRLLAPLAALTLLATGLLPGPAQAQTDSSDNPAATDAIAESSRSPLSGGSSLDAALSSVQAIGSSEFTIPDSLLEISADYPKPLDQTIDTPRILSIGAADNRGIERWAVASPAMSRTVELQVLPAADPDQAAPILILLDGINAPRNSGWVSHGNLTETFAEDNVTLIMPTEARASMYLDWHADDPVLGRHQWETFLAKELPDLLTGTDSGLNTNKKIALGGLSMGASGAITIVNANPGIFNAAFGISGCYSTTSPAGRLMSHVIVESRGGDSTNLYGPATSERRQRYDVTADPSGLADIPVYLSATTGAIGASDALHYGTNAQSMAIGVILEQGAESCTRDLDSALRRAGSTHQEVHIREEGAHNWETFAAELAPAWAHIKSALD